jgi:hypothetical protein
MLDPHHLEVVKDNLLLKFLVERGGQLTMSYEEMQAVAQEYDGYAVHLLCEEQTFTVTVHSPERVRQST